MNERKHTTISIPTPLYEKVKDTIKETGFTSASDYITYVLREILSSEKSGKEEVWTSDDEKKVRNRLKSLGYME